MKWMKFRVKTITEAEDVIISALYDLGFEGAQIEDKVPLTAQEKEQMFVDILPQGPEDDGVAYLSFFVEENEDGELIFQDEVTTKEAILELVEEELESWKTFMDIGEGSVEVDETEDIDWINNWKQYFHQFYIDDILVIPSWEEVKPEDEGKMVLHIDPGTAFGTGMHETTQLCIRQLRKYITPETELLDVGTGSGILSILSLMFGAKHAVGTDLDPCAVPAVQENSEVNGIRPEQFDMLIGNIISDKDVQDKVGYDKYDIVVANILADVLVPLTPVIVNQLKTGGYYITSGIIDDKEETVVAAVKAAGLTVVEVTYQGEWVSVTARKDFDRVLKIIQRRLDMFQFFVDKSQISEETGLAYITGADVNHICHVLRMKGGEQFYVTDGESTGKYLCALKAAAEEQVVCEILRNVTESSELPCEITLYQGLPKADKMELIIQKAVELGVSRIVPVAMKRSVVKLDDKKAQAKISRWQGIAEAATKQSKRDVIPQIGRLMSLKEALKEAEGFEVSLMPYENAEGMEATRRLLGVFARGRRVAIFIGPEGGFEDSEVEAALSMGTKPVTLGRRILRTETAGLAVLAMLVYVLEV